jgi:hypothetical protein
MVPAVLQHQLAVWEDLKVLGARLEDRVGLWHDLAQ